MTATSSRPLAPLDFCPVGMLASEKLDGVHVVIDGGILRSRHGRRIACPGWFIDGMPDLRIHAELFAGRGNFATVVSCIQRKAADWRNLELRVFDCDGDAPFIDRMDALDGMQWPRHATTIPRHLVTSRAHVDRLEIAVCALGGEGIVIRRPCDIYRPGTGIHKIKRIRGDQDRWNP